MIRRYIAMALLICSASMLFAIDAKTIVDAMDDAMDFDDATFNATMTNKDRLGTTSMNFTAYQLESGDTLLEVTSGADRGQKILRLNDDIYIYYPDAEEVVRLSGSSLKNSFLGSDFSYEDLTGDDDYDKRYDYVLDRSEEEDGIQCYVLTFTAKKLSETYQKQVIWVDQERFVPIKGELYSRSGKLLKTMYYSDYYEDDGIYFPQNIYIENNVKKNSSSTMKVSDIEFNSGVDQSLFDKDELGW